MRFPVVFFSFTLAVLAQNAAFDYIIIGGGTCGLVVANRLSEDSAVSVLVIEVGDSVLQNQDVSDPSRYGAALRSSIDYQFQTTPQQYAGNRRQVLSAGKAIGGTSTINGMAYTRAETAQIDAWEKLGNAGWNAESLKPYYLKSEQFQVPDARQVQGGASYNPSFHGYSGPLKVGFSTRQAISPLPSTLNSTFQNLGIPYSADVSGGTMRGFNVYPKTIDSAANLREDAARAYYWPFTSRGNLHMMVKTTANKLVWGPTQPDGKVVASGVEVTSADGQRQTILARKEVIVAAGALTSPALLERSGIGNPKILSRYGVLLKVSLPGVGENLIDQNNNGATFQDVSGFPYTGDAAYLAYPNITDILGRDGASALASATLAAIPTYASAIAAQNDNSSTAAQLQTFLKLQHGLIFTSQVPVAEIIMYPGGSSIGTQYWSTLPFARGNVHITSASPTAAASINPNYFMLDYDIKSQIDIAKFMRKLFSTAPLTQIAGAETWPGTNAVPTTASDATWSNWLKANSRGNFHVLSTASMMPRNVGGVVSPRLMVYGTKNVRVVDASVVPMQVCGHLMSTLYALAERAADIIKADNKV